MTPSLFDLPLRLGDAVALAALVYEFADGRPINDEVRGRIAGRVAKVESQSMRAFAGSLERDPIHPSAYYCCVDGLEQKPLLLRIAPATAPSSGLFPKAILIGRTHLGKRELVLNAVPFGPGDHEPIQTFLSRLNPAFQPKPFGTRPIVRTMSDTPAEQFPRAMGWFRNLLKSTGQNMACFAAAPGVNLTTFYFETVWASIRAGWREGYVIQAEPDTVGEVREAVLYTRFAVRSAEMIGLLRTIRPKSFDVELVCAPREMRTSLESLQMAGYTAQSVRLEPDPANPAEAEEIAQQFRVQLNLRSIRLPGDEMLNI